MKDKYLKFSRETLNWIRSAKSAKEFKMRCLQVWDYALDGKEPTIRIPKRVMDDLDRHILLVDKELRSMYRQTDEYKKWRSDVFARDGFTCQICGQVGVELNAHHIKQFAFYPELRYEVDNGVTLCKRCHVELHRRQHNAGGDDYGTV